MARVPQMLCDVGPFQCLTSGGPPCKCVNLDHLNLGTFFFFEGAENSFGFLQPGGQHPSLILSLSASVTLPHHHPACMTALHCNQVETEVVGDVTYITHRDCCIGDLCNSAVARTTAPTCFLAAAATALAWVLPGLWRG